MFTGIIQEIGTVEKIEEKNGGKIFSIKAGQTAKILDIGDSVSVDGACLTVIEKEKDEFRVEAIPETLKLTIARSYKKGTRVNLEPAMQIGGRFHGHLVSGHVDFVGKIVDTKADGNSTILTVSYPKGMGKYFSLKGSVTLNGVSLTISKVEAQTFEVSLIPHTLDGTNLRDQKTSDGLNVEIDLIARYLETLLNAKEDESNYFFLKERGFI
jgi:riboflavin synthase